MEDKDIKLEIGSAPTPVKAETPIAEAAKPATPDPLPMPKTDEGKSFQHIFNQKREAPKDTRMITTILTQKEGPKMLKPILGQAPALQRSIQENKIQNMRKKLRLVQFVFLLSILASFSMAFYFYSELSPTFDLFGLNTTNQLKDVNENLRGLKTRLNSYTYKAAQLNLNTFSYISDVFFDESAKLSNGAISEQERNRLIVSVQQSALDMPALLKNAQENLIPDLVVKTVRSEAEVELTDAEILAKAQDDLKATLTAEKAVILQNEELSLQNMEDIKLIDNTIKLVGNTKLINTIKGTSIDELLQDLQAYSKEPDQLKRKALLDFTANILSSTKSDIGTIGALKASRLDWSQIIEDIEAVTAEVPDSNFGLGLIDTLGQGIEYTGYEFETTTNKIVLTGSTKTNDATNFTLISNLIDTLELAEEFKNVEMRSFTKSGSIDTGFSANFKIDLELELTGFSDKNKPIALEKRTEARVTGKKRIINN